MANNNEWKIRVTRSGAHASKNVMVTTCDGKAIATIHSGLGYHPELGKEQLDAAKDANARLIASAPELLKALKQITAGLNEAAETHPLIHGWEVVQARKAIATAEGKRE
jgi:hypothetical protein